MVAINSLPAFPYQKDMHTQHEKSTYMEAFGLNFDRQYVSLQYYLQDKFFKNPWQLCFKLFHTCGSLSKERHVPHTGFILVFFKPTTYPQSNFSLSNDTYVPETKRKRGQPNYKTTNHTLPFNCQQYREKKRQPPMRTDIEAQKGAT